MEPDNQLVWGFKANACVAQGRSPGRECGSDAPHKPGEFRGAEPSYQDLFSRVFFYNFFFLESSETYEKKILKIGAKIIFFSDFLARD